MAIVRVEPGELKRVIRSRRDSGGDRWDEVWDGVYVMPPLPDNEHRRIGLEVAISLRSALGPDERIQVFAGCNVSDQPKRWRRNERCPDVALFLPDNPAEDRGSQWFEGPDLAVEIISRFDRSREKFGFHAKVGVRELIYLAGPPPLATGTSQERRSSVGTGRTSRPRRSPRTFQPNLAGPIPAGHRRDPAQDRGRPRGALSP